MKKAILGAGAALAALALAGAANAQQGYAGLQYSTLDVEGFDVDLIGLEASHSWQLSNTYELQLDGEFTQVDFGPGDVTVWGPTAHIFADGDNYKLGGFIGYLDADNIDLTGLGVEARFFPGQNWSLGGSVGWGDVDAGGLEADITTISGDVAYYINDNFRLDATATTTDVSIIILSLDLTTYGIGAEYQFANSPISIRGGFEHTEIGLVDIESDTFTIGARWTWGGSLKDRERSSAPFRSVSDSVLGGNAGTALLGVLGSDDLEELAEDIDFGDFDDEFYF